jgi:hypothetical protein
MKPAVSSRLSSAAEAGDPVIAWRSFVPQQVRWLRLHLLNARFRGHDDGMNGKG